MRTISKESMGWYHPALTAENSKDFSINTMPGVEKELTTH
jgi:hypothetical protein